MSVSFFIALRYFFSKKKNNFINIVSFLSVMGVALGTMALVIVLSVFNGLEDLIRNIYGSFDPDIKIETSGGKSFEIDPEIINKITGTQGVLTYTEVIEDHALVKYFDKQSIIKMKGVNDAFLSFYGLKNYVTEGEAKFMDEKSHTPMAILGRGVQYKLGADIQNKFLQLQFFYPRVEAKLHLNPDQAFNVQNILPGGAFALEKQYDDHYIFVPLSFAASLTDYQNRRTAIEIMVAEKKDVKSVQANLKKILGSDFLVKSSEELHVSMLRAIKIEKLFVYVTFSFILAVCSLNIFFSLTMLAIEKKQNLYTVFYLGATKTTIKNILLWVGFLIGLIGAVVGLVLGLVLCLLQQKYGLVGMGTETSLVNAYPVKLNPLDFIVTGLILFLVTFFISFHPANKASKMVVSAQPN